MWMWEILMAEGRELMWDILMAGGREPWCRSWCQCTACCWRSLVIST